MFNVGDYVTRKSYNNDIIFKIIAINDDVYYLKGVSVRLYADSYQDDLVICKEEDNDDSFRPSIDEYRNLNRNEYFYLPGRILHLDGDEEYLEKAFSNNKDDFFKFSYIYKKINDKYVLVDFKQA